MRAVASVAAAGPHTADTVAAVAVQHTMAAEVACTLLAVVVERAACKGKFVTECKELPEDLEVEIAVACADQRSDVASMVP